MVQSEPAMLREAVARFDDPVKLEAAVLELQSHGFDRADISFIARDGMLGQHPASDHAATRQTAEDPATSRTGPVENNDLGQGRTLATSMAAVIAAFVAAGFTVATGGTALLAAGLAAAAGLGVGAAGTAIGMGAGASERQFLDEQLARGGVIVWVRTRDAAAEGRALSILRAHGGVEVHLHDMPTTA